jgi:hypothetical protein
MTSSNVRAGSQRATVCLATALALAGMVVDGCGPGSGGSGTLGAGGSGQTASTGAAGKGGGAGESGSASNSGSAGNGGSASSSGSAGSGNASNSGSAGNGNANAGGSAGGGVASDGGAGATGSDPGAPIDANPRSDVGVSGPASQWPALAQPTVTVQGGSATSVGGQAQAGGTVHLVSQGGLSLDPTRAPPPAPDTPTAPANATAVTAAALAVDLSVAGSATLDGMIVSGGTDAVRQITAGGDIHVQGTLRAADLGGTRQGLTLRSLAGTVYVTGSLDSSGAPGVGQAGGALTIVAQRVVISGKVLTAGGTGPIAGAAGAIGITTTQGFFLSGMLDASGGDARGPAATRGGVGGALKMQTGGDIVLGGAALIRGGAASSLASDAKGGDAGAVTINSDGAVTFAGTVDGRGGIATGATAGGSVAGGASGTIKVGETAAPTTIAVLVPLSITGGDGVAIGGAGGTAQLEPHGGDLRLAGMLDVSGGNSAAKPGAGGTINGYPGTTWPVAVSTSGVDIAGHVMSNGGSITPGGTGNGAAGGVIKLLVQSSDGNLTLGPTGQVQTDGGRPGGIGTAGGGGIMYLFTMDGNASLHGKLLARGGTATDPGGTGGGGGFIYVFTDNNHGGTHGGILIIETDGLIDASGGTGTIGGNARSDGRPNAVAIWPVKQDDEFDVQQVSVLINSDGKHGVATGYIDNRGHIVVRGGAANGAGGDVQYHGRRQDGNETPLPGAVDMAGVGSGLAGDFAGE